MVFQAFYPERVFPDLYQDVMLFRIFPDSKTFADASPLIQPEEINKLYLKINRADRQQVLEFVNHWFQLPQENAVITTMKLQPIDQHISTLWAHLIRPPDEMDNTIFFDTTPIFVCCSGWPIQGNLLLGQLFHHARTTT